MRDERDDPFGDIFDEIERMMNEMTGAGSGDDTGFATETHVSVLEEGGEVRVVADLPGIEKEGVDLKCDGTTLTISAAGRDRQYEERIRLPVRVDEHSATASFNNGVLEVSFARAEPSAGIDVE